MAHFGVSPSREWGCIFSPTIWGVRVEEQDHRIPRPWRIVAAEAAKETDSQKLLKLISELSRALDEQEHTFRRQINRAPS